MFVAAAMALIAFVAAVIFSRRIREGQEQRGSSDAVPAEGNVSFTDTRQPIGLETGLSAEVQAARQPALVPAPPPVAQAAWTTECDTAVAALVSLKIPKREAISLVRQSPGTTVDEILGHAFRIRGQGRGQSINGHAPGLSTPASKG
jgi:hypothetical protein